MPRGSRARKPKRRRPSLGPAPEASPGWRRKAAYAFKSPPLRHRPVLAKGNDIIESGSIGVRGGYAGPVPPSSRPQAPGHRHQFDPARERSESCEAGGQPGGGRGGREKGDRSREPCQQQRSAGHQDGGKVQSETSCFGINFRLVDPRSPVRADPLVQALDCSSSHLAGTTPLAAVLQVLRAHVN